jgi:periplasmic protein TonB
MRSVSEKDIVMNQNTILQSNLLDIIFENRNKEYGAYILRKSYNTRMCIALLSMISISLLFSILISKNHTGVLTLPGPVLSIPDQKVARYQQPSMPEHRVVVNTSHPKKINAVDLPPRILDSVNINKLSATPIETMPSLNLTDVSEINPSSGEEGFGNNQRTNEGVAAAMPVKKTDKMTPVAVADIMPQYPDGLKALLNFLKKNLHTPEDIEEGNEISVKVKFVVNYTGEPESFDVIKSGGAAFDNEVLRVLKKMPLWIPGKSNGENISVYYVVPVKFTNEF